MKIDIDKLTIPIYLNTKIVFDMLATIEDGFSEMKSVQTSNMKSKGEEVNAEIGAQNVFSLLKIGIGANKKNTDSEEETISEEKTHTTVSLFQKLKSTLEENQFIKQQDSDELMEGDFVEIKGTLKPNPVIDLLENFRELMTLFSAFDDNKGNKSKSQKMMENQKFNQCVLSDVSIGSIFALIMNERLSIEQGMLLYERKMNYILLLIKTISRVIILSTSRVK